MRHLSRPIPCRDALETPGRVTMETSRGLGRRVYIRSTERCRATYVLYCTCFSVAQLCVNVCLTSPVGLNMCYPRPSGGPLEQWEYSRDSLLFC